MFPIDISSEEVFAGAGLVFIATGVICGRIRLGHMCRPFSEHERYFYPARRQTALFYSALLTLFPYVLAPEDPAVWTYARIWGIIYYPAGFALLIAHYFSSFGTRRKKVFRRFILMTPTLYIAALLVALLAGGDTWIALHEGELRMGAGALSLVQTGMMAAVLADLKRAIDRFSTENYSNEEDFPSGFAKMMVAMPLVWVAAMWAVFLSGSHWVKFAADILASLWMVRFLCIILHPQRLAFPQTIDNTMMSLKRESDEEIAEIEGCGQAGKDGEAGEDDPAVREKVLSVIRRRFREPHLLKSEVLLDIGNGDMGKAGRFIAKVGYYSLVNMFRLEYARLYKDAHPLAKQEEIAEEAGFSSRTAYYKAKKYVGEIDPEIVRGVSLDEPQARRFKNGNSRQGNKMGQ